MTSEMRHGEDSYSTYVAVMFALCGGVDIMDNDMLSRTTTTSGGGECKDLRVRSASAATSRAKRTRGRTCDGRADERVGVRTGVRADVRRAPGRNATIRRAPCDDMRNMKND